MRLLPLALTVLALASPSAAVASVQLDVEKSSPVTSQIDVGACNGRVSVVYFPGLVDATGADADGLAHNDPADPNYCQIDVNDQISGYRACVVIAHEYTHLSGYRAQAGHEHVRLDGSIDPQHTDDPNSLMSPSGDVEYAPCRALFPAPPPAIIASDDSDWTVVISLADARHLAKATSHRRSIRCHRVASDTARCRTTRRGFPVKVYRVRQTSGGWLRITRSR
jgi:hypothetical protein